MSPWTQEDDREMCNSIWESVNRQLELKGLHTMRECSAFASSQLLYATTSQKGIFHSSPPHPLHPSIHPSIPPFSFFLFLEVLSPWNLSGHALAPQLCWFWGIENQQSWLRMPWKASLLFDLCFCVEEHSHYSVIPYNNTEGMDISKTADTDNLLR